jgi:hypothetical protein
MLFIPAHSSQGIGNTIVQLIPRHALWLNT